MKHIYMNEIGVILSKSICMNIPCFVVKAIISHGLSNKLTGFQQSVEIDKSP